MKYTVDYVFYALTRAIMTMLCCGGIYLLRTILRIRFCPASALTLYHITKFNERMAINGKPISNKELCEITERVKLIADEMEDKPTEFELVTAIAFEYFALNKCEYVVLECGLGGRLDSTNIVKNVSLSVITGISFDHTSILGNTIEKIAYEKAGIIKENVPVLWCGEDKNAERVILEVAKNRHAPVYFPDHDEIIIKRATLDETFFDYKNFRNVTIKLLGKYQPINSSNVMEAICVLADNGLRIDHPHVIDGLAKARWQARFEKIMDHPLVIFDGGHNPEGVDACVDSIRNYFGSGKVYVLTGVMADKDYTYMAKKISLVAAHTYTVTPDNPRALSSEKYSEVFESLGVPSKSFENVKSAVECAIFEAKRDGKALFCLGSLYMYGEVVKAIKNAEKQ